MKGAIFPPKQPLHLPSATSRDMRGKYFGLIEAPRPSFTPVERNRGYHVEGNVRRQRARQVARKVVSQWSDVLVFEEVNQVAQRPFVLAEAISAVEALQAVPAQTAAAFLIKGKFVVERCAATGAEVIRRKGFRRR